MNEELLLDLINRDIDGMLDEAETRTLREELRRNPEARKLHGELQAMNKRLGAFEDLEPPADFHKSVMRKLPGDVVQRRNPVKNAAAENGLSRLLKSFFSAPWRPALVGAAAVVLVVFLLKPGGTPSDTDSMPGTMIERLETVNAGAIENLISCKLLQGGDVLVLELELLDADSGQIQLAYDKNIVEPRDDVKALPGADAGKLALRLEQGKKQILKFKQHSEDIASFQIRGTVDGRSIDLRLSDH